VSGGGAAPAAAPARAAGPPAAPAAQPERLRGYLEVGLASLANGSIGVMVTYADMPTTMLLCLRMAFAAAALGVVVVHLRRRRYDRGRRHPRRALRARAAGAGAPGMSAAAREQRRDLLGYGIVLLSYLGMAGSTGYRLDGRAWIVAAVMGSCARRSRTRCGSRAPGGCAWST